MEAFRDTLTDEQRKALKKFKQSLNVDLDPSYNDELLIKFLRARSFNLKAAKKNFLENYNNRMLFGVNNLLDTYVKPEVIEKYETVGFLGFAKDGTLIRYMATGRLDACGFIMSMSCTDFALYFSYIIELDRRVLQEENLRTGKNVSELTYIFDLEEFSIKQVLHKNVIEIGLNFLRLVQDCYPEIWKYILVVNVPEIFHTAFPVFKVVLRSTTLEKFRLAKKDNTKYLLLQYIDEDVLPAFLGGKRVDSNGDPMCKEFISFGGRIPEKYYSNNCDILLSPDDTEVRLINIGPRSMFNQRLVVKEANSILKLQARSEHGSLSFAVAYKEFSTDPENIETPGDFEYLDENSEYFKYKKVSMDFKLQTHCAQENMTLYLPWSGIYIIRFSNSNSWFSSRKLYIKYKVMPPNRKNSS